jgi:hypothetical protein
MANKTKSTGQLIAQWSTKEGIYRLVSVGKFTPGFDDLFVIEKLEADALGIDRWIKHANWRKDDGEDTIATLLVAAIKELSDSLTAQHRQLAKQNQGEPPSAPPDPDDEPEPPPRSHGHQPDRW